MPLRWRSYYANGLSRRGNAGARRYVARNFRDIGIHSEFNIENMKLFRGWLCAYDEISKQRMYASVSVITDELSMATRRINSHWERKIRERNS